jgi:hypothetical protein
MSKAIIKVTTQTHKQAAKSNKYLGAAAILQEQLELINLETKKLDDEITTLTKTYTSVASIKHERKLKDTKKEGAVNRCKQIIEARERICNEDVDKLQTRIEKKKGSILQLEREIELLEKQISNERTKAADVINEQATQINSYYEQATIEVPVEVKYPPIYYKKKEQMTQLSSRSSTLSRLISIIDKAEAEADVPVVRIEKLWKPHTPWSQLNVKEDAEEVERKKRREKARQEDLELQRRAEQEEHERQRELYLKREKERAIWRKAEEVQLQEDNEWEEELTDEQLIAIQRENTKKDIKDLELLIADTNEELTLYPNNAELEESMKQYLLKNKELKAYLKQLK